MQIVNDCIFAWVAQLCHMFHWKMEDCLDLSVAHFFGMLRESNIIMSRNYAHLADIAYIPNCGYPYYEQLKARYARVLSDGLADEPPNGPAPLQTRKVFKSESVEAKYAVMELFKGMGLH